ncbi:MAG: prefoldin subunit alpha [Candidatus Verstraetearchaeota archaeon]|nr:prefoldin subunit alpha [Candidatus Verstraetearchaeota archaeon]
MSKGGPLPTPPRSPASPKEALDPLLVEFSNLKAYSDMIRQQLEFATGVIAELALSKVALQEIKSREGKGETLLHIGGGNYIRTQLQDVKTVVVGVGAGVSIEKSLDDAITDIDGRTKLAQNQINSLQNQYLQIATRMEQLQAKIDQLYAQLEASGQA